MTKFVHSPIFAFDVLLFEALHTSSFRTLGFREFSPYLFVGLIMGLNTTIPKESKNGVMDSLHVAPLS